jgi:serine/threonine-protein kinase
MPDRDSDQPFDVPESPEPFSEGEGTLVWDGADEAIPTDLDPIACRSDSTKVGLITDWRDLGMPFAEWDRYEPRGAVGEGGMGRVVRAFDPRLERDVALKFLRDDDRLHVDRLLREAQTQAKVNHPNVCTVHEVGEVQGQPYIAMQLIDGQSLDRVAGGMTLPERVHVMIDVCEAVHAAHRVGLIHRDLKPENVMVERDPDGRWVPYVLDFGIAQSVDIAAASGSGGFAGTPAYFSPEQAGAVNQPITERSDVYALGATLYQTLVGRPPFSASSLAEMINTIISESPPRPRELDASIPADLEAIVLRAMARDPNDRFPSARGLADDLRRYLEGDPVEASAGGLIYRLGKRFHKNRVLTAVVGVAVAAVLIVSTVALWSLFKSREQTRIAQQMGIEISAVEQSMRQELLLPLHDITGERTRLIGRLDQLEIESAAFGPIGRGPALYALGRGYVGLYDNGRARRYLEEAWELGYRTPEVALALGTVLGRFYQTEIEEIARIPLPGAREKRRLVAETELRDRALELLREAEDSRSEQAQLASAWIALYEGRWDDAITATSEIAANGSALSLDARTIEANAHLLRVRELREDGEHDGIEAWLDAAGESIERAIEVARSDPSLHHLDCLRWISQMEVEARGGLDIEEAFERARAAGERTLTADPHMTSAHRALAQAWLVVGEHRARFGTDPRPALGESIASAERAVAVDPEDFDAHVYAGLALWTLADVNLRIGADPDDNLDRAEEHLSRAMDVAGGRTETSYAHLDLGMVQVSRGTAAEHRGEDPVPHWDRAVEAYRSGLALEPELPTAWLNLGNVFVLRGEYAGRRGADSSPFIDEAIAAFERSLELDPNLIQAYASFAAACWAKSDLLRERGKDIEPTLRAGIDGLRRALDRSPNYLTARYNLGNLLWLLADDQAGKGRDPTPHYSEAREHFARLVDATPRYAFVRPYIAGLHRTEAEYLLAAGVDLEPSLEAATAVIDVALAQDPSSAEAYAERIEVALVRAGMAIADGKDPSDHLDEAQGTLNHVGDPAIADSEELLSAAANFARVRAEWRRRSGDPYAEIVALGLEISRQALTMDATSDRTRALQGALHLLAAESAGDPDTAAEHRAEGERDLAVALRRNPALALMFGRSADARDAPRGRP